MFGFGKKKKRQSADHGAASAPQGGLVRPGKVQTPLAANALQLAAAGAGLDALNTGETIWLQAEVVGLTGLDLPGLDVRIEVSGSKKEPLVHNAVMDWHGILDDRSFEDLERLVNEHNINSVYPRVFVYTDKQGHTRLRGQVVMTWWCGHTVAQLDGFVRYVVAAAGTMHEWVSEHFPQATLAQPDTVASADGMALGGADQGVEFTEAMLGQFITDGNPYGLLSAPTSEVTADRIADAFAARSGHRPTVNEYGFVEIGWNDRDVDIVVNSTLMSVGTRIRARIDDYSPLLSITNQWSTNKAGAVALVQPLSGGGVSLMYMLHEYIGAGLTDEQLSTSVREASELVADCLTAIIKETS